LSVSPGRFSWWDTHDETWRQARLLFVLAAGVVAFYAAGILVIVSATLSAAEIGPWQGADGWFDDIGLLGVVLAVLVLVGVATLAIMGIGWRGLPRTTVRLSRARPPGRNEEHEIGTAVASFALAYGMPTPRVWIIDDPAPNGLAFGRPASGNVCVTAGALRLAHGAIDLANGDAQLRTRLRRASAHTRTR
jgi:Zn-dependent protease with chaperone function